MLPRDTMIEVFSNSDKQTMQQLCLSTKSFNQLCHSVDFWHQLFYMNNFIILNEQPKNWINEFHRTKDAYDDTNNILFKISKPVSHDVQHVVDAILNNEIYKHKEEIFGYNADLFSGISFYINDKIELHPNPFGKFIVYYTYEQFKLILIKLVYYQATIDTQLSFIY